MKLFLVLLLSFVGLTACNNSTKNSQEPNNPVAKTIDQKEVTRIALVEVSQLIQNAKENDIDFSAVMDTYDKAKAAFDNGEFKQAQILAVDARHLVEGLLHKR